MRVPAVDCPRIRNERDERPVHLVAASDSSEKQIHLAELVVVDPQVIRQSAVKNVVEMINARVRMHPLTLGEQR